ncbi:Single hybrid motif superfamily protein [Euphorbia peplus]|nr:Single hybrid motif superfamily protein [Euphorbia peplus]
MTISDENDDELQTEKNTLLTETTIQKQLPLDLEIVDEELHKLLLSNINDLPPVPRSAIETNFISYFAPDFIKPGHDQYVHRHANGLCVIGLASTYIAFKNEGAITVGFV